MSRNQSKMNKEKQIFENQISLNLREDKTLEIYVGDSLAAEISDGRMDMEFAKEILLALNVATEEKILDWYNFHKLGLYTAPMPKM